MDPGVIGRDRKQGFFAQSFLAFSDKLISQNRIQNGIARLKSAPRPVRQGREAIRRARSRDHGVLGPGDRLWVLLGKLPVLRALATLAYDCRRPDMFRAEFMDALRIIDRGDLTAEEMIGSWAGELGPDPIPAFALPQARDRLRWRWPAQSDHEHPRCHRVLRQFHCSPRLEARPALARGGACARQSRLGPGRPHHSTPTRKMGRVGRDAGGRRQACRRHPSRLAPPAHGPLRSRVPRLREFSGLPEVEPFVELLRDGRLPGHAPRRRAAHEPGQPAKSRNSAWSRSRRFSSSSLGAAWRSARSTAKSGLPRVPASRPPR